MRGVTSTWVVRGTTPQLTTGDTPWHLLLPAVPALLYSGCACVQLVMLLLLLPPRASRGCGRV